jgi:thiol-disulfide isomerase/thioredoxin
MSISTEKDLLSIQDEVKLYAFVFSSTTCGPCKKLKEYIDKISDEFKEMNFVYIDLFDYPSLFDSLKITSVPKTMIYLNKKMVVSIDGGNIETFTRVINEVYEKYIELIRPKGD